MKSKQDIQYFMRKLYRFFESNHRIEFRRLKGLHGMIFLEKDGFYPELVLDHRRDLFSTLIHEVIHYLHPDWCETDVLREETEIVNSLTTRQIKNIIKRFAEVL